jgi:methionine-rich copper-binding protein CopC
VAFAAPASAHTRLVSSSPAQDAEAGPVGQVSLVFSDRIRTAKVLVKDAAGKSHESGEARLQDRTVTQPLTGELPSGAYTVMWRVVGEDGHPIQSEEPLRFSVSAGAASPAPSAPQQNLVGGGSQGGQSVEAAPREDSSGGGARWLMVGSGLLLGLGIGFMFVFMRKGPSSGE